MILTCPKCATRYFLHDVLVGRAGRTVKCAACAATWRAEAPADEPLNLSASSIDEHLPSEVNEAEAEPEGAGLRALSADKLSQTIRARAQVQKKVREAAATGAIWAGLAAGMVLVIALGAVFRMDVVRLWPKTASAYAAVGLPVNTTGLIIEQVKASPSTDNGQPAVSVSGVMRNIADRAVAAPPLRVSLLTKGGRPLARRIADTPEPKIRPGETRHFAVSMINPPQGASDVEVTFALQAAVARSAAAQTAVTPKLRGPANPAPIEAPTISAAPLAAAHEAKPLPPTSPYALPGAKPSVG